MLPFFLIATDFDASYATSKIHSFIYQLQDVKHKRLLIKQCNLAINIYIMEE